MAYTHSKYEVHMQSNYVPTGVAAAATPGGSITLGITGVMARWTPGFVPHYVRGIAVVRGITTFSAAAGKFHIYADVAAAGTPTSVAQMSVPTAGIAHKSIYYRPTYDLLIKPGHHVDFNVTAADDAAFGEVILYVEPTWEEPANITSMYLTT